MSKFCADVDCFHTSAEMPLPMNGNGRRTLQSLDYYDTLRQICRYVPAIGPPGMSRVREYSRGLGGPSMKGGRHRRQHEPAGTILCSPGHLAGCPSGGPETRRRLLVSLQQRGFAGLGGGGPQRGGPTHPSALPAQGGTRGCLGRAGSACSQRQRIVEFHSRNRRFPDCVTYLAPKEDLGRVILFIDRFFANTDRKGASYRVCGSLRW